MKPQTFLVASLRVLHAAWTNSIMKANHEITADRTLGRLAFSAATFSFGIAILAAPSVFAGDVHLVEIWLDGRGAAPEVDLRDGASQRAASAAHRELNSRRGPELR